MNILEMEATANDACAFILGNPLLHGRFFSAIDLLAQIVIAAPRSVSVATLSEALGQPVHAVRGLLQSLGKSGLVYQDEKVKDVWRCTGTLEEVTLADVFRCLSTPSGAPAAAHKRKCEISDGQPSRTTMQKSVDLLLMQATMAVNQVVLQHLQKFDLGRLRTVAPARFRMMASRPGLFNPEVW